ncbi:MAG: hypothetical protein IJQ95_07495 [Paludibacteraceae bacterium]|nr:hypothetical protein [Paludibacteraceae bacterium]
MRRDEFLQGLEDDFHDRDVHAGIGHIEGHYNHQHEDRGRVHGREEIAPLLTAKDGRGADNAPLRCMPIANRRNCQEEKRYTPHGATPALDASRAGRHLLRPHGM